MLFQVYLTFLLGSRHVCFNKFQLSIKCRQKKDLPFLFICLYEKRRAPLTNKSIKSNFTIIFMELLMRNVWKQQSDRFYDEMSASVHIHLRQKTKKAHGCAWSLRFQIFRRRSAPLLHIYNYFYVLQVKSHGITERSLVTAMLFYVM